MALKKGQKIPRPDIFGIENGYEDFVVLAEGQQFYETPETWELWQESPQPTFIIRFLKREYSRAFVEREGKHLLIVYYDGEPIAEYEEK